MNLAHTAPLAAPVARPGLRLTLLAAAPAFYVLLYPAMVDLFHHAVGNAESPVSAGGGIVAALALVFMFSVPFLGFVYACHGRDLRARRLAYAVVVAPTLYCMLGVTQVLVHSPVPDELAWVVMWLLAISFALRKTDTPTPIAFRLPAKLRVAHGISALIIVTYVIFHLTNHLFAWSGKEAHAQVMQAGRAVYRSPLVEPVLVLAMLFQVATGLALAWRWSARQLDFYRTFQVASGLYLAVYILGHMNSVFVFARAYLGIDTGWDFATGAPNGLLHDAWSVRLIAHYALGIFFTIGHLFSGLRSVLLAHGTGTAAANAAWWLGTCFGALLSLVIMLAMCGMRL